jgi:hypothetical protein
MFGFSLRPPVREDRVEVKLGLSFCHRVLSL